MKLLKRNQNEALKRNHSRILSLSLMFALAGGLSPYRVTANSPRRESRIAGKVAAARASYFIPVDTSASSLSINDIYVAESTVGTSTALFTVSLSQASTQTVAVTYTTQDGTATAPDDYVSAAGLLTFAPGQTIKTVAVTINSDAVNDPNETFNVNLSNAVNAEINRAQGQATILAPVAPGDVVINELRTRGAAGASDEFVELQNASPSDIDISGYKLLKSSNNGTTSTLAVILQGTILEPGQSYLVTNTTATTGYSLKDYGGTDRALGNQNQTSGIADDGGVALARSDNTIVDQVGFTTTAGTGSAYGEGTRLAPTTTSAASVQFSYVRKQTTGVPQDTNDNANDFVLISTSGAVGSLSAVLGAPAPKNLASPRRNTAVGGGLVPNVRDRSYAASDTNATFAPLGTLTFNRRYTNNTTGNITRLRFRVIDITTVNSPDVRALYGSQASRQAVLRVLDRTVATALNNGTQPTVTVDNQTLQALVLEQPPNQSAQEGGLNSSLNVESILTTPLAPNASVDVQFRTGVQAGGYYRFFVIFEALP
ncbi:MAG: Calx-beta domain-containing protein [Pyrinomonadaceae bacterium]